MALTDFLKKTKTVVYDPSTNSVSLAGMVLDGLTTIDVKYTEKYKTVEGVHGKYIAAIPMHDKAAKLTLSFLPTAQCLSNLHRLYLYIRQNGGMFEVVVANNGINVLQGTTWFLTTPDYTLVQESSDVVYSFGVNLYTSPSTTQSRDTDFFDTQLALDGFVPPLSFTL